MHVSPDFSCSSLCMQICCLILRFKEKLLIVEHFQLLPDLNNAWSLWTTLPFHLVFIPLVFPVASDWALWAKKASGVAEINPDFWRQHDSPWLAGCCGHITAWQLWTAPEALSHLSFCSKHHSALFSPLHNGRSSLATSMPQATLL